MKLYKKFGKNLKFRNFFGNLEKQAGAELGQAQQLLRLKHDIDRLE